MRQKVTPPHGGGVSRCRGTSGGCARVRYGQEALQEAVIFQVAVQHLLCQPRCSTKEKTPGFFVLSFLGVVRDLHG